MHDGSEDIKRSMYIIFIERYKKDNNVRPLLHYLQHSHVHCTSYIRVSIGKERLISYQGRDSNSFLHRTLTKLSNKSILNDQASLVTL